MEGLSSRHADPAPISRRAKPCNTSGGARGDSELHCRRPCSNKVRPYKPIRSGLLLQIRLLDSSGKLKQSNEYLKYLVPHTEHKEYETNTNSVRNVESAAPGRSGNSLVGTPTRRALFLAVIHPRPLFSPANAAYFAARNFV